MTARRVDKVSKNISAISTEDSRAAWLAHGMVKWWMTLSKEEKKKISEENGINT